MRSNFNQFNQFSQGGQQTPSQLFPSLWEDDADLQRATSSCLAKVFVRMFIALLVTAVVSFGITMVDGLQQAILSNFAIVIGVIIAQLALVIIISFKWQTMSSTTTNIMFFLYAIATGISLSIVFMAYVPSDLTAEAGVAAGYAVIFEAFAITSLTFAAVAIYGVITKRDLTRIGNIAFMGLIGIILASIVNFFFRSDTMTMIVNYVGVLIFVALTAFHVQKIKRMLSHINSSYKEGDGKDILVKADTKEEAIAKVSVLGALLLYLDFINLFLRILAILGRRR